MEKKSNSFRRLGRFFKSRSSDAEKGGNEVPSHDTETAGSGDGATSKELPGSKAQTPPMSTTSEGKKKPFGSWRSKRKNLSNVSISPPSSPSPNDRSFDLSDVDQDSRPHSRTLTSLEDTEDSPAALLEDLDKSKASPTESPKKDVPKKPGLGKFGTFFTTSKKKQVRGVPESPTSPTEKSVTTYKSEKEVVKERKKVIVVASASKVQAHSSTSDQSTQHNAKDSVLPVGHSEKNTNGNIAVTNQNSENTAVKGLEQNSSERSAVIIDAFSNGNEKSAQKSRQHRTVSLVKELKQASSEGATAVINTLSQTSQKSFDSSTPKIDRQNSNEKSVRNVTHSSGRRNSTEGETTKYSVRKVHEESPKVLPKKTSRFSGKVTDSKYKISDKPLVKSGSTDKINTAKFHVALKGDSQDQGSPAADLNLSPDSVGGRSILRRQASGDLSPVVSPTESDLLTASPQDKRQIFSSNGQSNNGKVLAFDIYLSKSATNSPTPSRGSSSEDAMERNSPSSRKPNRKRRSLKSQSSQNEEKKIDIVVPHDDVFDEGSFKGVQEKSFMSGSNIKPAPLSPESNGTASANPEVKAGANPKLSPKGESDKDKQQHPASSPLRKKNVTAWTPSSPNVRKAQGRDSVFRNQPVAAASKVSDFNQPSLVSTTKDAYVEKTCVPGSLTGSGGEESSDTVRDISPTAAGVLSQDKNTKQESIHIEQAQQTQSQAESDSSNKSQSSDAFKNPASLNDSSKSTVTSKLNIPPRPKNVELPIKPKAVDTVDEPTIEVNIPKGNIASKVSLFESKKTSYRQVDIYATKNISQPKKFVERAKLNFVKQAKGNVWKDSSPTVKSPTEPSNYSNKKTDNGHGGVKADNNDKAANHKVDCKPSEDISQGNLMPMEDRSNGLETIPGTIKPLQESILPSAENDDEHQLTEVANGLTQNTIKCNALVPPVHTEEPLLHSISDDRLDGKPTKLNSRGGLNSDFRAVDMGNKHDSIKEQPTGAGTSEESNSCPPKDSSTLPADHVDSTAEVTLPSDTDKLQNGRKEVINIEKSPEELTVKDKTKPADTSDKAIQPKDITHSSVNEDLSIGDVQLPTNLGYSKSDVSRSVPADFPQREILNEDAQKSEQLHSEVQYKEEAINDQSVESIPDHTVDKEESLPTAVFVSEDKKEHKEFRREGTLKYIIFLDDESSIGYEKVNSVTRVIAVPEDHNAHGSVSSQEANASSHVSRHLVEEHLFSKAQIIEDDQTILSSSGALQDHNDSSAELQDQSSSVASQDLDNFSIAPQDQINYSAELQDQNSISAAPQDMDKFSPAPQDQINNSAKLQDQNRSSIPSQGLDNCSTAPQDQINNSAKLQDQNRSSIPSQDLDNCSTAPQGQIDSSAELQDQNSNGIAPQDLDDFSTAPQDQMNFNAELQGHNSSSVTPHDLDNFSLAPQDQTDWNVELQDQNSSSVLSQGQKTLVVENVSDGIASGLAVTKEADSQLTDNEHKATPPIIKSKNIDSKSTMDLPADVKEPNTVELDVAVGQTTINQDNIDNVHVDTLNNDEQKGDFSTTINNNVACLPGHVSSITSTSTLQNGCLGDTSTTILNNGNIKHTDSDHNFSHVQNSPESSFNISVRGEDSILDSSSDMEIFAETIRKLDSPITLHPQRKKPRTPKPPGEFSGLPSIREDFLEKILDNDSFSFGLAKNRPRDLAPMALFKMQSKETAEKQKPKRASAEQSMLLKSLRSQKEPLSVPQETCDKENADVTDVAVKRSRIESFYSGLKSPFTAREDNVFSPSVTTVSTMTTSFDTPRKEFTPLGKTCDLKTTDCANTTHTAVREDLTVLSSDFSQSTRAGDSLSASVYSMDNHLDLKDLSESLPVINGQPNGNPCTTDGKGALPLEESSPKVFYFTGQDQESLVSSLSSEVQSLQGPEKINPRPGKLVILTDAEFGGAVFEVFTDVPDCSSWELSPTIFIKTIRGCWILYELPNFEGRTIPLEEGDIEVTNPWGEEKEEESSPTPVVIGSLRHVVKDYRVCQIDLFTDPGGLGIMSSFVDDTEELQVYGKLQRTCSIKVHFGVWLIYEEAGFQGIPFILEPGEYPDLSFWNTQEAYIGSVRPLKMGSRKVEIPYEPKIIIFEKPMFEGRQVELDKETMTFKNLELTEGSGDDKVLPFYTVGSMRILSGLWVGFEKPGFEGHQYLLEEGDYEEWSHWGGYNGLLQSLRPVLSDFSTPHMIMYSEKDFDEKAANIDVLGIISNMEETGFGNKIQSIKILNGVWVAYECSDFTGEQYILEKGTYSNFSAWGAKNAKISSVQPILMEAIESPWGHFKIEVFSEPDFKGQNKIYEDDVNTIEDSFKIMSCKISSGRWALYEQADFSGDLWLLEEGIFPNLCAVGCPQDTTIRSLKIINYEFSEPNVVLYGNVNFKGRRVKISTECTDLQAMGYSPDLMSLEVLGGIWVFYEYANYRGRQLLISPSKIAQCKQFSSWHRIGSLRPLRQKRLYIKLRNKGNGMVMSTNGNLDDIKLVRAQVMEDSGAEDQIWVYQKGVIRCRIAEDCSLASSGSIITTGSKIGFAPDAPGTSPVLWSISPEGRIHNRSKPNLVLDVKGGSQYDQQHIVLNPVSEDKLTQLWEICVL